MEGGNSTQKAIKKTKWRFLKKLVFKALAVGIYLFFLVISIKSISAAPVIENLENGSISAYGAWSNPAGSQFVQNDPIYCGQGPAQCSNPLNIYILSRCACSLNNFFQFPWPNSDDGSQTNTFTFNEPFNHGSINFYTQLAWWQFGSVAPVEIGFNGSSQVKILYKENSDNVFEIYCQGAGEPAKIGIIEHQYQWFQIGLKYLAGDTADCYLNGIKGGSVSVPQNSLFNSIKFNNSAVYDLDDISQDIYPSSLTISNPKQYSSNGITEISENEATNQNTFVFKGYMESPVGANVKLQVEVRPSAEPFTNIPTASGDFVATENIASVVVPNLPNGSYHWQARGTDTEDNTSAWQAASNQTFTIIGSRPTNETFLENLENGQTSAYGAWSNPAGSQFVRNDPIYCGQGPAQCSNPLNIYILSRCACSLNNFFQFPWPNSDDGSQTNTFTFNEPLDRGSIGFYTQIAWWQFGSVAPVEIGFNGSSQVKILYKENSDNVFEIYCQGAGEPVKIGIIEHQYQWFQINIKYDGTDKADCYLNGVKGGTVFVTQNSLFNSLKFNNSAVYDVDDISESFDSAKRNPVIIVPGIIASYLNNAANNEEIWPNFGDTIIQCIDSCQSDSCKKACIRNCAGAMNNMLCSIGDNFLDQLILKDDGSRADNNPIIKSTDIFRTITDQDFYAGLIQELENNGYEENKDLFVFPYDWRLNIDWIADNNPMPFSLMQTLKQRISEVKTKTGAEKVDIIAHSLGGLVVKDYIEKNGTSSIDKFIDIATPHLGSPLAFKILNYGDDLGICIGDKKNQTCFLNVSESKEMSQNMPAVYQLLPSRKYFESTIFDAFSTANYIYDVASGDQNVGILSPLDYNESINFLAAHKDENKETRNQFLLGYFGINAINVNDELHSRLDNLPNSDKYYNIVGCGQDTFSGVKKWNNGYKVLSPIDGDNTVPFKSASEFANADHRYYVKVGHSLIPSANGVRQLVASILQGTENDFNFSAYRDLKQDDSICGINGAQIGAQSPVELHAYDEDGNHTGPLENGVIEEGITGSSYDVFGKDQYIFLPAGHNYHIVNQATSSGELGITIDEIKDSQPVKSVYFDSITLNSALTTVEYDIADNQTDYQAVVDSDGNGIVDKVVDPSSVLTGAQLNDLVAPQTSVNISGQIGNNGYYVFDAQIGLIATDDNSGVLKTEYSLDNGQTWQNYQDKIILSNDGDNKVVFRSFDKAGNQEADQTVIVKIDKTEPIISVLLPQEGQEVLRSNKLNVTYFAADNFSGIATATAKIYLDGQVVNLPEIDLFKQNLGAHQIKITIQDLAGNQTEQIINFSEITDINGTIADVNRVYDEKMIDKVEVKNDLINSLADIKIFQEKYGQRIDREKTMRDKAMAQCLKHKNQAWCNKKIGTIFDRFEYRLNKINQAVIKFKYNLILVKLDVFLRAKWINQVGYTIIKEDIKYLINKV